MAMLWLRRIHLSKYHEQDKQRTGRRIAAINQQLIYTAAISSDTQSQVKVIHPPFVSPRSHWYSVSLSWPVSHHTVGSVSLILTHYTSDMMRFFCIRLWKAVKKIAHYVDQSSPEKLKVYISHLNCLFLSSDSSEEKLNLQGIVQNETIVHKS